MAKEKTRKKTNKRKRKKESILWRCLGWKWVHFYKTWWSLSWQNKNKHRFNDNVSVINVYDIVKPNELNIVDCPFLIDAESGDIILNISSRDSLKRFSDRRGYGSISEYIINNKQLKDKGLILFGDLYNMYVESSTLDYFSGVDNIKVINLFE